MLWVIIACPSRMQHAGACRALDQQGHSCHGAGSARGDDTLDAAALSFKVHEETSCTETLVSMSACHTACVIK